MRLRHLRLPFALAVLVALAIPAASLSAPGGLTLDRGIVQSVDTAHIELRALDGSVASFAVSAATRIKLNGVPATVTEIRPGYVATVVHDGDRPAVAIRAFGRPPIVVVRGVVSSLTRSAIGVDTDAGPVSVPLDGRTVFRFRGGPGLRRLARPGALVVVRYREGGPAVAVNVLKRARA